MISSVKVKISPEECLEKNNLTLSRTILIIDPSLAKTNDLFNKFDWIYEDFLQALISENTLSQQYIDSNLNFYFSKGTHFLMRSNLTNNNISILI